MADVERGKLGIFGPVFHIFGRRNLCHARPDVRGSGTKVGTCLELVVLARKIMTLDVGYARGWSQHQNDVVIPDNDLRGP